MIRRAILLLLLLPFARPAAAWACICSKTAPALCQGLPKDGIVFLGTVTEAETLPLAPYEQPAARATRFHFHVDERFAGADAADLDIFSGGDDGDCSYRFRKGAQYLVFTHQANDGRLFATICGGTRFATEARAMLPQLRAMRSSGRVASVFGIIRRGDSPFLASADDPPGASDNPIPHVALKLRSRDDRFNTTTDSDGAYSFYDVHPGEYTITAILPTRTELEEKSAVGELPILKLPAGACYEFNIIALPTGHIQGSVLGPDGKSLRIAALELYRAGRYDNSRPGLWGFQGAKGVFDFDHVGAGEYVLVYNRPNRRDPNSPFPRAFYPGVSEIAEAKSIELKDGQQLSGVSFKVRNGFPTKQLRVRLKWEGAKLPGSIVVSAKAEHGINPEAQQVSDTVFDFTLLFDARYTISAFEDLDAAKMAALARASKTRGTSRSRKKNAASPPSDATANCPALTRLQAASVVIDPSSEASQEITLTLAAPTCN
ncbi:MAG: hypothetical protein WBP79_14780 [Candidatus Acidiferrales bacterium]